MAKQAVLTVLIPLVLGAVAYKCKYNGRILSAGEIYRQSTQFCYEIKCTAEGMQFQKKGDCIFCKSLGKLLQEDDEKSIVDFQNEIKGFLVDDFEGADENRTTNTFGPRLIAKDQTCAYNGHDFQVREVIDFIEFNCGCLFLGCVARYGRVTGVIRVFKATGGPCAMPLTTEASTITTTTIDDSTICDIIIIDNAYNMNYCKTIDFVLPLEGNNYCQSIAYDSLAEFDDQGKLMSMLALAASNPFLAWVNGIEVSNHQFKWVNSNSPVTYTLGYGLSPGSCLVMNSYSHLEDGMFFDYDCGVAYYILCEKAI